MKLYEHEAKTIIATYGVQTPRGETAKTGLQAQEITANLGKPVAIKAQVLVAGRGKEGGVKFADNPGEAKAVADRLFGTKVKGETVIELLVEEKVAIQRELYFGLTLDRLCRCFVAIASDVGGVDIEQVAEQHPQKIFKTPINSQLGFRRFHATQIAKKMGYAGDQMLVLATLLEKLYRASVDYDAELVEVNPLVETIEGRFVAVDARIILDDNGLFRHENFRRKRLEEQKELSAKEFESLRSGLEYVKLDGDIGVIGNGAGLVMSTLDMVNLYGGKPANFLDIGGGAPYERIGAALELVLSDSQVKVLFVNILGGITLCDEVARGIINTGEKLKIPKPLVVRLVGANEEEGKRILSEAHVPVFDSMEEAAKKAVEFAKKEL